MVNMLEPAVTLTGEKRVTLHNLSWVSYQQILSALPQTRAARLTYDCGTLEISVPSEEHEFSGRLIERFILILVVELGMKLKTMGSTTLDREDLNRGAEPGNAYYIQNQAQVAGRQVDLQQDPPPDLIVEVDISNTDIDKNRLYASMGVPEFWRFDGQVWRIFQREGDQYREVEQSPTFPQVEKTDLYEFLEQAKQDEVAAEVAFRSRVREMATANPSPPPIGDFEKKTDRLTATPQSVASHITHEESDRRGAGEAYVPCWGFGGKRPQRLENPDLSNSAAPNPN